MKVDRKTMRLALPPVVALAFVAVLATPLSASGSAGPTLEGTGATQATAIGAVAAADGTASTHVGIGAVAFPEDVAIVAGHLRTPVLLATDGVTGSAAVSSASAGSGCTAELVVGSPVWLDCDVTLAPGARPAVIVTLSDGRVFEKSITLG